MASLVRGLMGMMRCLEVRRCLVERNLVPEGRLYNASGRNDGARFRLVLLYRTVGVLGLYSAVRRGQVRARFAFRFALDVRLGLLFRLGLPAEVMIVLTFVLVPRRRHPLPLHGLLFLLEGVLLLETSPPSEVRPVVEHVVTVGIQRPVATLSRFFIVPWYLDETLVQTQVVPDGILPALLVLSVVREPFHYELVYSV